MPDGYSCEIIWTGLGLIPFCIAPHYRSDHSESALIDKSVEYFIQQKIPFVALHDGEALILDSKTTPPCQASIFSRVTTATLGRVPSPYVDPHGRSPDVILPVSPPAIQTSPLASLQKSKPGKLQVSYDYYIDYRNTRLIVPCLGPRKDLPIDKTAT